MKDALREAFPQVLFKLCLAERCQLVEVPSRALHDQRTSRSSIYGRMYMSLHHFGICRLPSVCR